MDTGFTMQAPDTRLRGVALRYCAYRDYSATPVERREFPTVKIPLILSFGPRIRLRTSADPHEQELTSFVAGLDVTAATTAFVGVQDGVQVDLTPLGAYMLLGMPMDELAGRAVELEEVLGADGRRLVERLAGAPDAERFRTLDAVIAQRLARSRRPSPAAAWAWRRLRETDGRLSIAGLAEELGCSHRYLIAELRAHTGLPPKALARILRFERAIRLMRAGRRLADVAQDCGYYDQAHLNREFRAFAGTTPTEYVNSIQDPLPVTA